ncbi:hypothetical protein D3N24_21330 [Vibrio vulnificus]|nr:hypothetical protein [Vibrio vulnificus]
MIEFRLLVTSVRNLLNAYIVYGNCAKRNKRLSVFIRKEHTYKEPCVAEVWVFSCASPKVLINYRPQYSATSGRLVLDAFNDIESDLRLYERALRQYELPTLTKKLFFTHPEFRGIGCGESRISKAIERAGSARQFLNVLRNGNLPALVDAFESTERGLAFLTAYQTVQAEFESIDFIEKAGYDRRTAHRLMRLLGRSAKSLLTSNPYAPIRMGSRFNNAWGVAERLRKTKEMSIPDDSPVRLIGAIDYVVYRALKQNHTAISEEKFRVALSSLIGENLVNVAIDTGLSRIALCRTSRGDYQGVGLANLESIVEKSMATKIVSSKDAKSSNGRIITLINEFDEYSFKMNGFNLTEEQKKLAFNALTNDFSIAQGEGGTGKSTAMACVKYVCNRLDRPTYFVAVAGIAKKRVNDELERMCVIRKSYTSLFGDGEDEVCCYTVRGLIRQVELTLEYPNIKNAIQLNDNPLIVFDESSMLDLSLVVEFISLFDKHSMKYSISMVGDIAQIAPVGFGVVWQHLVSLGVLKPDTVPYSELRSVHRQGAGNPIRDVATLVRNVGHSMKAEWDDRTCGFSNDPLSALTDLSSFSGQAGVYYLQVNDSQIISNAYSLSKKLGLDRSQVITPYSNADNPLSTISINDHFITNERNCSGSEPLWGFAKGDRVIVTKNFAPLDLYNGDMATVTAIVYEQEEAGEDIQKKLVCKFAEKTVYIDESACFDTGLVHSYGITIHKTQGSEFAYTIVLLPRSTTTSFVENSMIYTALTRSKIASIFIGDMRTLTKAINSKPAYMRICSGFNLDAELSQYVSSAA